MSVELSPCPWCGGKNLKVINGCWVKCLTPHCGARGPMDNDTEEESITAWNTRTPDPRLEVAREALEFVLDGRCFEGLDGLTKDIYEYQYEVHCERQSDDGEDPNSEERIEGLYRMIKDYKALAKIKGC